MKPLHIITLLVYILGILFAISAAVNVFGVGLIGQQECRAAIIICLVFYLGQKLMLYAFLVERTHVIRSRNTPRYKNYIYMCGIVTIVCGFTVVATIAFMWAVAEYDSSTGRCEIGLPARVALPLLTYDIVINLLLTAVFLYYVRPYLNGNIIAFFFDKKPSGSALGIEGEVTGAEQVRGSITLPQMVLRKVIRKTFWGCILVMPSTVANMTVLAVMKGHQAGWMCLTLCTLDGESFSTPASINSFASIPQRLPIHQIIIS